MRLNRLDLTRYGKFTETALSFPRPADGAPDIHIIYGPNEAGKSSFLSAWLDFLFQIPTRSPMNFLHSYGAMQIGAEVEIDGVSHELTRIKKRDNSLLDPQGSAVAESVLLNGLRGLDRAAYSAMFSLNGETLAAGGESILRSEGDLGQLLFSASAGLNDLDTKLAQLRSESEEYLSDSGRKGRLLELNSERDQIDGRIRELDVLANDYRRMRDERDAAQKSWQAAETAVLETRTRLNEQQRMLSALPLRNRVLSLKAQISAFGALPHPPEDWMRDLAEFDREQTESALRLSQAEQELTKLCEELSQTEPDDKILRLAQAIADAEKLKASYDTAAEDLPKRRNERDIESGVILDCLARLDRKGSDPEALRLASRTVGQLTDLIETRSGIQTALSNALRELEDANADLKRLRGKLPTEPDKVIDPPILSALIARLRREDLSGKIASAVEIRSEAERNMKAALAALAIGATDLGDITDIRAPERAWLESTQNRLNEAERQFEQLTNERSKLATEIARYEARQSADDASTIVTLAQAAEIRQERERLWSEHRAKLDGPSADAFEKALRLDDQASATLTDQHARRAAEAEAARAVSELRADLAAKDGELARTKTTLEQLNQEFRESLALVSPKLDQAMSIDEFIEWLHRLTLAKSKAEEFAKAGDTLARVQKQTDDARKELVDAILASGGRTTLETSYDLLLDMAQSISDRASQMQALRERLEEAQEQADRRQRALDQARQTEDNWQEAWKSACKDSWLAGTEPDPAGMRAVLDTLQKLQTTSETRARLDNRIHQMEQNQIRFSEAVRSLSSSLSLPDDGDPVAQWRNINQRYAQALKLEDKRNELSGRLETAEEHLRKVESEAAVSQQRLSEIMKFFAAPDWPMAREAMNKARERHALIGKHEEAVADLCERLNTSDAEAAVTRLEEVDPSVLEAQIAAMETELKEKEADVQKAYARMSQARDVLRAVDADGTVARLEEERATLLLEIADGAQHHLRRKLGLIAVEEALRRYRDTHRSGMLNRASQAFSRLTGGAYRELAVQPEGARDLLVALAQDGGSKRAEDMSDGTRAQLYLSLRIAGYHEFTEAYGPVPFVADDIMESFDDDRAEQAFGLLAEIGRIGQVVYLTHHAHVRDLAKSACKSTLIQTL